MSYIGRRFGLSNEPGSGVSCGENGAYVGGVPLLERVYRSRAGGHDQWHPRPVHNLNRDLGLRYGLPIEFDRKVTGLRAVAQALSRNDITYAQIATLHLQIPDPPPLTKSPQSAREVIDLARRLQASGLLKSDWTPPSIRAGRPEVRAASAENSLPPAPHPAIPKSADRTSQPRRRNSQFQSRLNFQVGFPSPQRSCPHRLSRISVPAICREIPIPIAQNARRSGPKQ